ncbi:hypothetical protein AAULR_16219 [Lacticaseibacillus rhamnosus MTCC 5462]|nr:hypothetical protein AAULR_16219 [Lacticaseibacillus rhamnosus MTCC 5462]
MRKEKQPYSLTVQLAYQDKTPAAREGEQPAAPATLPTREEAGTSVTETKQRLPRKNRRCLRVKVGVISGR